MKRSERLAEEILSCHISQVPLVVRRALEELREECAKKADSYNLLAGKAIRKLEV